jgi:hypothetical protein
VTHSPYARAPDLSVTLSHTAGQYLTLFFHHVKISGVSFTEKQQLQVLQILLTATPVVALKNVPTTDKFDFNVFVRQVQNISMY